MHYFLLTYSLLLLAAMLISALASRSIISTSVLFLVSGILLSPSLLGVINISEDDHLVKTIAELALYVTLFTDGMRMGIQDLRSAWKLPGRALLLGMPLTMVFTALLARGLIGYGWGESILIGAVLSPTDPVFASAIIGARHIPARVRHLLHVESGVNDGIALPVVVVLLGLLGVKEASPALIAVEALGGVVIGVVIPWLVIKLEQSRFFQSSPEYQPLGGFAIGICVLAVAWQINMNQFLAGFAAGVTIGSLSPPMRDASRQFGYVLAELVKLAALMVFGAVISSQTIRDIPFTGWVFVILVLILVRTLAIILSLLGSGLSWAEVATAAWFGPRGFASVVYGLMILDSQISRSEEMFHLIAVVVVISIVTHSSSDVLIAQRFEASAEPDSKI